LLAGDFAVVESGLWQLVNNIFFQTVVKWVGEPVKVSGARNYYSNVLVDNEQVFTLIVKIT
jgi:hypothetical protein